MVLKNNKLKNRIERKEKRKNLYDFYSLMAKPF